VGWQALDCAPDWCIKFRQVFRWLDQVSEVESALTVGVSSEQAIKVCERGAAMSSGSVRTASAVVML
jgi:hypothetical protein